MSQVFLLEGSLVLYLDEKLPVFFYVLVRGLLLLFLLRLYRNDDIHPQLFAVAALVHAHMNFHSTAL